MPSMVGRKQTERRLGFRQEGLPGSQATADRRPFHIVFAGPQVPWLNSPCRCSDSRLSDYGLPAGTRGRAPVDSIVSKSARPFSPIHSLVLTARPIISPFRPIRITVGVPVTRYHWLTAPFESRRTREVTCFSLTQLATWLRFSRMFTARTVRPFWLNRLWTCSIFEGNSLVHTGHHVAQK